MSEEAQHVSAPQVARILGLVVALIVLTTACTTDSSGGESGTAGGDEVAAGTDDCPTGSINVSGSSTVEPISRRAAELYEDRCGGVTITVDGPGTGDGFKLFCAGETDISDASRPIKASEAETCEEAGIDYTELKVAFDGIAVMTNPSNSAVECLSFVDLYALLGGQSEGFGNWSDANPLGASLGSTVAPYPDAELSISAPGTESGTYDSFIEIVLEGIGEQQEGEEGQFIRQDFSGNADDNVIIEGIAGADTSLGWVGFAFADENADRVKTLAVSQEPGGTCIAPSVASIADGSYPVSRSLYIYVNNAKAAENPAVAGYVEFYLGDGYSEAVTRAFGASGYVELPGDQLAAVRDAWDAVR